MNEDVWGNGKERRPPSAGRQNGGRHFLRGWCRQTLLPPSADVVGDGGWESRVEQMVKSQKRQGGGVG